MWTRSAGGSESVSDSGAQAESPEIRVARIAYEEASAREADGVALLERRTRQSTRAERDYRDSITALKKARSKSDDAKAPLERRTAVWQQRAQEWEAGDQSSAAERRLQRTLDR